MLRSLFVLVLALAPVGVVGCTGPANVEVELGRPLILTTVDDPGGALKRVVEAVQADGQSGLDVADAVVVRPDGPSMHEVFVTGPEKHVLEDYIRTHPELAPPAEHQFAYERLRGPDGRTYWRMHCVEAGGLTLRKLASASLVDGDDDRPRLRVRLGAEDGRSLAALTTRAVGRRLAAIQDEEVLMAPVIHEPLTAGTFEISLGAVTTRGEAEAALHQLLGRQPRD
ncbi:SecDF P1 head subdomain-containing protein [Nannocystis pusilla]|uniref:SecDF P1 head subdomain domain-containing protein n=1 Tax=Nannocystis pusilla TaxID=889268 RepID=A0ABS7TNJ3_9BACT|nr:hypothetical protein [Nannocystis pusilla]MBZ5709798.1 hypothetical protein [Nannocystis pusilla]